MDTLLPSSAIWAMHPEFLAAFLKRGSIEAVLPDAIKSFASIAAPQAKAADPVREGATAILAVDGMLTPKGGYQGTSTVQLANRVREFAADAKIGAVILNVSSPGGLVWGTRECGDAIFEARQVKPVVAVANPYAFSAAHWIACQASAFYASPSADVGSVGVRMGHTDMSGLEEKIGMRTTLVASHPDKVAGHPYAPLDEDARADMQAEVDEAAAEFIAAIARGRTMRASEVPAVHGTGKTFSAKRAAAAGAIDGVMTLREVVARYGSSRSRLDLMRRQAALLERVAAI